MHVITFFLPVVFLLMQGQQSKQCSPGPGYKPPTITNLTRSAPIVVRGYVVNKGSDINIFKACLFITHVYKGIGIRRNYICVSRFGSSSLCLSNPRFGVEYLFFLNRKVNTKLGTMFEARYDSIHSAVQEIKKGSVNEIRRGKCCPNGNKCRTPLRCRYRYFKHYVSCFCGRRRFGH